MKHLTRIHYILALFCSLGISAAVYAQGNWTVFHGPAGDNKSTDTGLLQSWPEGGPKLLWSIDFLGYGYSGVSVADGRIFITGNDYEDGQLVAMVYCLDEKTGELIWKSSNGPAWDNPRLYPSTRANVTIDGDFVYDHSVHGHVACFDAKTGRKIWSRNIAEEYESTIPVWGLAAALVIDGNNVITVPSGRRASVVALNKRTGETVWKAEPIECDPSYTPPYFFTHEGQRILAVITGRYLLGLDPKDGSILFSFPFDTVRQVNVTMPIYYNGHLFLTHGVRGGARLLKLTRDSSGQITPEEVWFFPGFGNMHYGVVFLDGYVYGMVAHSRAWAAINFMTGEITNMERHGQGSIHYADGLIYGLTERDHTVILWKPDPERYIEVGRFQLPNDVDGPAWAHPVVTGGRLYLRHGQFLYCYDVTKDYNPTNGSENPVD